MKIISEAKPRILFTKKVPFLGKYLNHNLMFNLLGHITEELTGVKWEELIKREVFDKLGMSNSTFLANALDEDLEFASFYLVDGNTLRELDWQSVLDINGEDVSPSGKLNNV